MKQLLLGVTTLTLVYIINYEKLIDKINSKINIIKITDLSTTHGWSVNHPLIIVWHLLLNQIWIKTFEYLLITKYVSDVVHSYEEIEIQVQFQSNFTRKIPGYTLYSLI